MLRFLSLLTMSIMLTACGVKEPSNEKACTVTDQDVASLQAMSLQAHKDVEQYLNRKETPPSGIRDNLKSPFEEPLIIGVNITPSGPAMKGYSWEAPVKEQCQGNFSLKGIETQQGQRLISVKVMSTLDENGFFTQEDPEFEISPQK